MRCLFVLSLVLATSCLYTHRNTGRFEIHATLVDADGKPRPTCDSHKLGAILVVATNTQTGAVTGFGDVCTAGVVLTRPMPLGTYELDIQAMGNYADLAGEVKIESTLVDGDDDPIITATIQVRPPTTQLHAGGVLTKQGAPASCDELNQPVIQVVMTPDEGVGIVSRIFRCSETNTTFDVPYGPFTVTGMIADRQQQILGSVGPLAISATRGLAEVELPFDVP